MQHDYYVLLMQFCILHVFYDVNWTVIVHHNIIMQTGRMYKQNDGYSTILYRYAPLFSFPWLQQQLRQQRLLQRVLSVIKQSKPSSTGSILSSAIGFYASHATMLAAAIIGE